MFNPIYQKYFFQHVINIWMRYFTFFCTVFEICLVFHIYSMSQFGTPTFQGLNSHMWLLTLNWTVGYGKVDSPRTTSRKTTQNWFSKRTFPSVTIRELEYQGYALPTLISELYNLGHNPGIREPSTNLLACGIQYLDCSPETRPQLKILLLWKRGRTDRDSKSWSLLQFTLCHWNILAHLPFHVYIYLLPKVSNTNVHPPLYPAFRILEWCTTLSIMSEDSYLLA